MIFRGFPALAAMMLPAGTALAGPPYTTDDPGVLDRGGTEVIAYLDAVLARGSDTGESGIDATVGLGSGIEAGLIVPLHSFEGGSDRLALGDVSLTAKISLVEGASEGPDVALGPQLALPTGGKGRARAGLDLPLWIRFQRGSWSVFGGGGYRFAADRDGGDLPFGGIVAQRLLGERFALGGEFHLEGKGQGGATLIMAGPGLECALSRTITLVTAGHAILANRRENGRFHIYAALVVTP